MASPLLLENIWLQQHKFEDAELLYRQSQDGVTNNSGQKGSCTLAVEIAQVRHDIQKALDNKPVHVADVGGCGDSAVYKRLDYLEKENKELRTIVNELRTVVLSIQASITGTAAGSVCVPSKHQEPTVPQTPAPVAAPQKPAPAAEDDDDDCDLFGSDDEEAKALKEKRLKEYADKKGKKPALIAKSNVVLDVKPWDDETDMVEMEKRVRSIVQDGLLWGASKFVPVGYGIKKLSITCVVEDEKVSIEELSEKITDENDDLVQSVDVAAFNKI